MSISPYQYKIINRALICVVVVFGLYLALAPVLPEISFRMAHDSRFAWVYGLRWWNKPAAHSVLTPRTSMAAPASVSTVVMSIPKDNTLSIPQIGVYAPIIEGETSQALEHGVWHRPKTGTPATGGNTVLVGHRFLYTSGANTLYHLDKLKVGDELEVFWLGQRYTYIIDTTLVASPTAVEIEQPTAQPTLTVYTCTPLFTVDKRLVIRAHLQ